MTTIKQNKTSKLKKMTNLSKSSENVLDILEVSNKTSEINSIIKKLELDANILTIISFINNLVDESSAPFYKLDENATVHDIIKYINDLKTISIIKNAAEDLSKDATVEEIINYLNSCNIDSGEINAIKSKFGDILHSTDMYDANSIDSLIRKIYIEIKTLEANIPTFEEDPMINNWLSSTNNIQIGNDSKSSAGNNKDNYSVTLGKKSETKSKSKDNYGVAIGYGAASKITNSENNNAIAIGHDAKVNQNNSIQLGSGTNDNAGTLQFRNYPLVDNNGKIFEERIPNKILANISTLNNDIKNIPSENVILSNYFGADTNYNLASWIDEVDDAIGDVVNNLSVKVPDYETDPVFTNWLSNSSAINIGKKAKVDKGSGVAIGQTSTASGYKGIAIGDTAWSQKTGLAIGSNSIAFGDNKVAVGSGASALVDVNSEQSIATVQLGRGKNETEGTLQFRDYPLVDANGKIFEERIPTHSLNETDPVFTEWKEQSESITIGLSSFSTNKSIAIGANSRCSGGNSHRSVAIGAASFTAGTESIAIGGSAKTHQNTKNSIALGADAVVSSVSVEAVSNAIQLGSGTNTSSGTLQFRNYSLVDANGKIVEERIPDKIINIVNNLSNMTDLSDSLSIVNSLSEKIDTEIANLSNKHKEDIDELSSNLEITNDSISELSNEFNSEITEIKAENTLSFCEIYGAINDLSVSVTQDIKNLYDDLSDEILSINDIIADLSDTLSNEISVLNSKIDELSNNLENSINESINNMIIDEVIENSNSLVKSSGIFKALQKDFVKIELSSDETIPLKNNTVYSITTETNEITPTLQFPITGKGSDEILISIRSENSSGVKYDIDASDNRDSLIYTQDGKLTFDHSSDNYATVIKGEFDGLFWYVHDHTYKRVIDNKLTIKFDGSNNFSNTLIGSKVDIFTITSNENGDFIFSISDLLNDKFSDWQYLYSGNHCPIRGWAMSNATSTTLFNSQHNFTFNKDYSNRVIVFYPIYNIETINVNWTISNSGTFWTQADKDSEGYQGIQGVNRNIANTLATNGFGNISGNIEFKYSGSASIVSTTGTINMGVGLFGGLDDSEEKIKSGYKSSAHTFNINNRKAKAYSSGVIGQRIYAIGSGNFNLSFTVSSITIGYNKNNINL